MVSCPSGPMYRAWLDGEFVEGFICAFGADPATHMFLALVVFGGIGIALFVFSGSAELPAVLGIMLAGAVFVFLPASATTLALVAGLLIVSIGGVLLTRRLSAP